MKQSGLPVSSPPRRPAAACRRRAALASLVAAGSALLFVGSALVGLPAAAQQPSTQGPTQAELDRADTDTPGPQTTEILSCHTAPLPAASSPPDAAPWP